MLSQERWIKLAPHMRDEFDECLLEGLDVEDLRDACEGAPETGDEDAAREIYDRMHRRPTSPEFTFEEPSSYPEIAAASPGLPDTPRVDLTDGELLDRLEGAWTGRVAGCLLGKPVEGWKREDVWPLLRASENYPMRKYIMKKDLTGGYARRADAPGDMFCNPFYADLCGGVGPADDDTNYTVLALKMMERCGRDFTPEDVMEAWLRWMPYLSACTAERVAYRNGAMGLLPPDTATYYNPFREWIGAQIRTDFYGYVNPGDPRAAAEMAFRDASVSHTKNGIYGAMFAAACVSAAVVCTEAEDVVLQGTAVIPRNCRLRRDIDLVREWRDAGLSPTDVMDRIHEMYPPDRDAGWVYTNPNTMIVTMALLYGGGDFAKSLCLAVEACFDTDCNGATVGSVMGMLCGRGGIGEEWTEPFRNGFRTDIAGFETAHPGDLARRTLALIKR